MAVSTPARVANDLPQSALRSLRGEVLAAPSSGIVEVFNHGRGREGLIPLWVGEGDLPMPDFAAQAMIRSIEAGETFYSNSAWPSGIARGDCALYGADSHKAFCKFADTLHAGAVLRDCRRHACRTDCHAAFGGRR